jgi:hypothetical protein
VNSEADVSSFPPHRGAPQTAATKIIKPPVPLFEDLDLENFDPGGEAAEVLRRKRSLYRLPAIITPRRDERGRHIEDADDGKNMPLNAVVRRYFFGEEKPMAFLRHFDVRIQADERPEKLLGGHVHDADPAAMRYYYTDFLMQPEFQVVFCAIFLLIRKVFHFFGIADKIYPCSHRWRTRTL